MNLMESKAGKLHKDTKMCSERIATAARRLLPSRAVSDGLLCVDFDERF
jgi:hypothetical protein